MLRRSELDNPITKRLLQHENEMHYERRNGDRIQANEAASIAGVHSRITCDATINDVSTHGMNLTSTLHFPVGTTLIVEWSGGFVPCTVRHVRAGDEAWQIGVEVEPLPGVIHVLSELKRSAQERNRSILLPARICA